MEAHWHDCGWDWECVWGGRGGLWGGVGWGLEMLTLAQCNVHTPPAAVTPMLQVIRELLGDPNDNTEISLVFANLSERDIMLRDELDGMALPAPRRR